MPHHEPNSPRQVLRRWQRVRAQDALVRQGLAGPDPVRDHADSTVVRPLTTVDATIRPTGSARYRHLGWAPGEPHLMRDEHGAQPSADRAGNRRSLLYLAQHSDMHLCDAQAPARLVGGQSFGWANAGADAGHRPQETCTTQVFDQLVRATNAVAVSPLSGAPMAFCIQTGDHTDNRTDAEVGWWLDVLAGRPLTPNTGVAGRYEGVQRSGWKLAWQPDRPGPDRPQRHGFPVLAGFLDAAVARFEPEGLRVPWLSVFGNHDQLFLGTYGPTKGIRIDLLEPMLSDTGRNPTSASALVAAISLASAGARAPAGLRSRWERLARGRGVVSVAPDPEARRPLALEEYLARILAEDGGAGPVGHGFTPEHLVEGTSWWSRPEGDHVQVIGLDTCHHTNGDGGRIGPRQAAWLEAELARHHSRHLDRSGRSVESGGRDRLVVLASHHNSWTIGNLGDDEYDPGPALGGPGLVDLIARFPNVLCWINGHSHQHRIAAHRHGGDGPGWWEINTGSVIDFGQQGRTIELFDNGDGTLSLLATLIDHAAPPRVTPPGGGAGWSALDLAATSRELAANDDQWFEPLRLLGSAEDRNVELPIRAPFSIRP